MLLQLSKSFLPSSPEKQVYSVKVKKCEIDAAQIYY